MKTEVLAQPCRRRHREELWESWHRRKDAPHPQHVRNPGVQQTSPAFAPSRTLRTEPLRVPVLLIAMALTLSGCLNLKPTLDESRFFVLTPLAVATPAPSALSERIAVGIGRVDIPEYLQPKRIAVRKGSSEVEYFETLQWAERLDKGFQRVMGANLRSLLPSANMFLSAWRRSDVQVELHVSVQRFESDTQGQSVLEVRWRITNPGAEVTWRTGLSRITKQGPPFATDPDGAVASLNEALGDLSRELAMILRESPSARSRP